MSLRDIMCSLTPMQLQFFYLKKNPNNEAKSACDWGKKKKGRKKNKPKNALYSFFQNIFKLSGVTH